MAKALAVMVALTALALLSPTAAAVTLRYQAPVGRVAEYRLTLKARGNQVSLGERRPVRVDAEFELREEVVATGPADSFWLRLQARPMKVRDPSGTFAAGERSRFPETELQVSPQGQVLASQAVSGNGPFDRAFSSLMMGAGLVVLPTGPVTVGEAWRWEERGVSQESRLVSLIEQRAGPVARIATRARSPVRLQEGSQRLGVTTDLSGEQTEVSELELLAGSGVVRRHKGEVRLVTNGDIWLQLPGGRRRFPVSSEMRVTFDLRLVRMNGQLLAGR